MADKKLKKCEYCKERKLDVKKRPDSYDRDVNNKPDSMHVACNSCDYERCQDI